MIKYHYDSRGSTLFSYDSKNRITGSGYAYDNIGNPTTYKGRSVTWKGKQLTSYAGTTFTYDGKGRRKSKGDITFTYDCDGNLIKQSNGLEFFYDSQGVAGFVYNGENYYYQKDIQGNIFEIKNDNGNSVVKYYYDAWGNCRIDGNSTIGAKNPFRYRGYYYDTETGLYYLQTRYYDPETCRFLNMDSIDYADPSSIGGLNLYAYCNNDPVNNVDPSGEIVLSLLIAFVAGAAAASISSIGVQLLTTGTVDWGQVGISAVFGGVSGVFAFTGLGGIVGQFFIQGAISLAETASIASYNNELGKLTIEDYMGSFITGGVFGMIGAKGQAKEFKRLLQVEKSLIKVLARDTAKNGFKGFIKTWSKKSAKYVNDFIKPLAKSAINTIVINTLREVTTYWFRYYTE